MSNTPDTTQTLRTGWRILIRRMAHYRREIIVLIILGFIGAVGNGATPYIIGQLFDAILSPADLTVPYLNETVPVWFAILTGWLVLQLIATFVDWRYGVRVARFGNVLYANYISRGFAHLLYLPLAFHKEHKHGDLGERINRGGNSLVQIAENVILQLGPEFLSVLIGVLLTLLIEPIATLILIIGIALYISILARVAPPAVALQKHAYTAWREAYGTAFDTITNVHAVKQGTAERHAERTLNRLFVKKASQRSFALERLWNTLGFYQGLIVVCTQLIIFITAILAIQTGTMSVGDLIALNGYALLVFGPFARLGRQWQNLQNGLVQIERAENVLARAPELYQPQNAARPKRIRGDVTFENVWFRYKRNEEYILKDLSFSARAGETVALVGPSGVGKSTTLDLLSGYYFPSRGTISVDGVDITQFDLERLRGNIAVVPQEPVLFNDTIKKNITYGAFRASTADVEHAAKEAHAHDFISRFSKQYRQKVGERGVKLSAGQKQRIAIARAILRDPSILILDEPTSALDAETERIIVGALDRLMEGRTTFIIAHRLSTVRKADRILVFDDGKIIESGTHDELMQIENGRYRYLYEYQVGLH